uniref:Nucleoside-diphosphate kinase n=1 Tax=Salvator merianae TaxID=96440 RepID=A0A8D0E553_SALMN
MHFGIAFSTPAHCYLQLAVSRPRSDAPFTPRVLLLGPPGSGKGLQAALLAQKYGLVHVHLVDLLKEKVAANTVIGDLIKPCFESGFPVSDSIVLRVLTDRLAQQDCRSYGWVLHGFPRDVDQAELLRHTGFEPNRVFFLHLPTEVSMQRISMAGQQCPDLPSLSPPTCLKGPLSWSPQGHLAPCSSLQPPGPVAHFHQRLFRHLNELHQGQISIHVQFCCQNPGQIHTL